MMLLVLPLQTLFVAPVLVPVPVPVLLICECTSRVGSSSSCSSCGCSSTSAGIVGDNVIPAHPARRVDDAQAHVVNTVRADGGEAAGAGGGKVLLNCERRACHTLGRSEFLLCRRCI